MAFPQMVLDTDTLSEIMKQRPAVIERARSYLLEHKRFNLSVITRYEILRGLKSKGASTQAAAFDRLCEVNNVLPVTDEVAKRGAEIYADLKGRGALVSDADILIAATAMVHGLGVVTNNVDHFKRVTGLPVETWQT